MTGRDNPSRTEQFAPVFETSDEWEEKTCEAAAEEDGTERREFVVRHNVQTRLDVYLQGRLKGISRNRVQKLIESGGVTVNDRDRKPKASTNIRRGDRIDVILPPPAIRVIEPQPIPLDFLYEDDWFVVINKQANLIVHPARSHLRDTLVNALAHHFKQQCEMAGGAWAKWETRGFKKPRRREDARVDGLSDVGADQLRPGVIHRLDKNTTGVMVIAKNDDAHFNIARQFEDRQVLKAYLALVHGGPDDAAGAIDQPIGKHPTYREPYAVRHDSTAKPSVTLYRVRERYKGYSLVELELKTGRTHQIRVHMSYTGSPVAGDILYGGEPVGQSDLDDPTMAAGAKSYLNFARDKEEGQRIEHRAQQRNDMIITYPALHAALLSFTHPVTGKRVEFAAPIHEPMRTLVRLLRQRPVDGPVAHQGVHVDLEKALPPG